ncbi:MAG: response regulator [Bacteroidetes bacterium]|nr:response regulator [Bacteroidota bacterium]
MNKVDLVLFVEDSPVDAFIHRKVITMSGLSNNMHHCTTGREALNFLGAISPGEPVPDLIFLDIRMPDLDGFEFLEQFERLPDRIKSAAKIVMLSSSIDESDLKKARSNPFVLAFVPKPLTIEKVTELFG